MSLLPKLLVSNGIHFRLKCLPVLSETHVCLRKSPPDDLWNRVSGMGIGVARFGAQPDLLAV